MGVSSKMSKDGTELTIAINGRFDFSQHQAFRSTMEKPEGQPHSFVVDLSQSEYMDSAALGMLLLLLDRAGGNRDRVKILNANKDVRKVLEIANFDRLFTLI